MTLTEVIIASPSHTDELVQASIDMIGSGVAILDGNGQVTVINKMWRDFGATSGCVGGTARVGENYTDACLGGPAADSIEARCIVEDVRNVLAGNAEIAIVEYEHEGDTELRSFQSRVERISGYHPPRILVTHEDVTAIHQLRSASSSSVATSRDVSVLGVDAAGIIRMANEAAGSLFGLAADLLPGRPLSGLIASYDSPAGSDSGWWLRADDHYAGSNEAPIVIRVLRNDGGEFTGEARRQVLPGLDPALTGVVIRDLTDRRRLATMLEFNAFHDALTGLPNRTLLFDHLERDLRRSVRRHTMLAAFHIEVERREESGVSAEPESGDWIDKVVATRLRQTVRTGDTIARLDSGRFVVIVPNLQEVGDACFAAQRLLQTLMRPIPSGDDIVKISAGIGAAIYPWDSPKADSLLDRAREALHIARAESDGPAVGGSEVFRDLFNTLAADIPGE
jgi:diguanylate cyclase (GGDEF)-like protein/PAS domain S-box-containing protein